MSMVPLTQSIEMPLAASIPGHHHSRALSLAARLTRVIFVPAAPVAPLTTWNWAVAPAVSRAELSPAPIRAADSAYLQSGRHTFTISTLALVLGVVVLVLLIT